MKIIVQLSVRMAWWWRFGYWPLTRFGLWLGLPIDEDRFIRDAERAVRVSIKEKPAAPDDATG